MKCYKPTPLGLRYCHSIIIATLILTVAIILIIIFQMILLNKYSLILLRVQTYLSHLSPLIFLSFLIFLFESWLNSKRNYIIVLYTISLSLGGGFFGGILIRYVLKKVIKILSIVVGLFLAGLTYLQSHELAKKTGINSNLYHKVQYQILLMQQHNKILITLEEEMIIQ